MATFSFPTSPSLNQIYTFGNKSWQFNGTGWALVTNLDVAQQAWNTANLAIINAATAQTTAQGAFDNSNTKFSSSGGTITGNVVVGSNKDLTVTGNLYVQGNTVSINSSSFTVNDPLIVLATGNYVTDTKDIGFAGHYNDGTNAHAGFIRDSGNKEFYVFQGYTPEITGSNNIDINDASFATANVNANYFKGNVVATTIQVDGHEYSTYVPAAFDQANTAVNNAASASLYANTGINNAASASLYANTGINNAASASLYANTGINNAASASIYANAGITLAQASYDQGNSTAIVANTGINNAASSSLYANTAIDNAASASLYANTAIDNAASASQYANTGINNAASASLYANAGITLAQASFDQGNSTATVANTAINNSASASLYANSGITLAQASFDQGNSTAIVANTAINNAASASLYANTAIDNADSASQYANTGINDAASASLYANTAIDNAASASVYANAGITLTQAAYDQGNSTAIVANTAINNAASASQYANTGINLAQDAYDFANSIVYDAGTDQFARDTANSAGIYANTGINNAASASQYANAGITLAQSGYDQANAANVLAQAAFEKANTGVSTSTDQFARDTANSAGLYANTGITLAQAAFDKANTGTPGGGANVGLYVTNDTFTANGLTNSFTLSVTPINEDSTIINFDGVTQQKSEYSLTDKTITFTSTPDNGTLIEVTSFVNAGNGIFIATGNNTENLVLSSNILPSTTNTYYLGSNDKRWHTVYVGPGSVDIDNIVLSNNHGTLEITGASGINIGGIGLSSSDQYARDTANSAGLYANTGITIGQAAFNFANSIVYDAGTDQFARNAANSAGLYANSGITLAQASYNQGNSTATVANTGINNAASASQYANTGINLAQDAYNFANSLINDAGTDQYARDTANIAGVYANTGITLAQNAYNQGNSTANVANTAYNVSSAALENSYSANSLAQAAYNEANNTSTYANTAINNAASASLYANASITFTQAAYNQSNSTAIVANTAINNAASASLYANNKVSKSGDTITGDLIVTGSANVYTRLAVGTGSYQILPNLIGQFTGTSDEYIQVNLQNLSPNGSADLVVTADNGTDLSYYSDLGKAGSDYSYYGAGALIKPNDTYLIGQGLDSTIPGSNVIIAATTATYGDIIFAQGGAYEANEVARFEMDKGLVIQKTTASSSNSTGALVVKGGVGVQGDVYTDNVYSKGVNVVGYTQSAFNQANTATNNAASASQYANTGINNAASASAYANIAINNAASASVYANTGINDAASASLYANTGITLAQAAYDKANTGGGTTVDQFARDTANTGVNNSASASLYANTGITLAQAAYDNSNVKFNSAGGTISGNVTISGNNDLTITGNLYVQGKTVTTNTESFTVKDSIIMLAEGNFYTDVKDIGFAASYNDGTNAHAGFIRDYTTKEWYIFKGYTPELDANNSIDINDASFRTANVNADYFKGNIIANSVVVSGNTVLTTSDLETVTYTANYITMNATSVTVPVVGTANTYGVYNFGDVTSIQTYGDYNTGANTGFYSVNDAPFANGAPGHVEYVGFTGVTDFNRVVLNINYTAASGHTQDIDVYNYQTDAWDTLGTYSGSGNWQQFALGIIDSAPYISSGNVTIRNYHVNAGNTSHRTWIDYVALEKSITGGQGPRGATGATGATGPEGNTNKANAAFDKANSAFDLAQASFNVANTASSNTIVTQGVDDTQNTNITTATNNAASASLYANTGITLAQAAYDKANTGVGGGVISLTSNSSSRITQNTTTGNIVFDLAPSGAVAGSYSYPSLQVDAYGRVTTISTQTPVTSVAGTNGAVSNTQLLAGIISVDGAGSGLDADLLDGQSGTYYTDYANTGITLAQAAYNAQNSTATIANAAITATQTVTLTNKRITVRTANNGATLSGNLTPPGDTCDQYNIIGINGTTNIQIPSGTPTDGQKLTIRIKDGGTGQTLTWVTTSGGYRVMGVILPILTTASKTNYIGCVYNLADTYWDVVAVASEV
jgi:hypothetical protein